MLLLATLVACLLAGCGGNSDGPSASAQHGSSSEHSGKARREAAKQPTTCRVGQSILAVVPEAPDWWREGTGPTLALACLHDRVARAAIIGYASPEGENAGVCVTAYTLGSGQAPGEQCAAPGVPWNWSCKGAQGCVHGFINYGGMTALDGPLTEKVNRVRVLVHGKPLREGVAVARVRGETVPLIGAEEPLGFFVAFIPGCVLPRQVKVELLDATGSRMGLARGWDAPFSCPQGA
jgi:hypothetical protein